MDKQEWMLKRNCSLAPRQLGCAYAVLFGASGVVALPFIWHGAWHVLAFALLEMACVALAFLHYARHATDHEHIALLDGCLLVEQVEADRIRQFRLDPTWTRVALPDRHDGLVGLESRGVCIQVGRFVPQAKRRKFAQELRQELQKRA